jgi:biopolymer transport protein ExbB
MIAKLFNARAALIACAIILPAAAYAAGSLDELLDQTKNARAAEARENVARVAKFQQERDHQAGLLAEARSTNQQLQGRSNQLSAAFDANEKKVVELQNALDLKAGNLGEMFGVVRQVSGDFASVAHNSMISVQYPDRVDFAQKLSQTKSLPSIADLERFWFEMQREATETGKVVKFKTKVVSIDGTEHEQSVTRAGPFTAVSDGKFVTYLPLSHQFAELARQPPFVSIARDFEDETTGYHEMVLDPGRGVLLSLYIQRPSWLERIKLGESVGYIIITVGVVGAVLAIYQLIFLLGVGAAVKRQLGQLDHPSENNPLGRVLATFKGEGSKIDEEAEIVELRISEAVLREVPKLERFQSFLRLAVAAGPLLGLIGTVIGMIKTFQSIVETGSGDPKMMAAGIGQAMIATVLGLGIAIPLLFINALLQSRSKQIVQILDEQSTGLLAERLEAKHRG